MRILTVLLATTFLMACASEVQAPAMQAETKPATQPSSELAQPLVDLQILSSDEMNGRLVGTPGNARARAYIVDRYEDIGLEPVNGDYEHAFSFNRRRDFRNPESEAVEISGTNVLGLIEGTSSDHIIVVTAHYDHLGEGDGSIFNGADDNASGVAGILAIAEHLKENPPANTVIIAALDAEEGGLNGARAFVDDRPEGFEDIAFNLNLDMLAYNELDELYAVGSYHYPVLVPFIDEVSEAVSISVPRGFDEPSENPGADWTLSSDHGPFHLAGIPFIYLGVDFHPHYHQPSDEYENMTHDFFLDAVGASVLMFESVDENLAEIISAPSRADLAAIED